MGSEKAGVLEVDEEVRRQTGLLLLRSGKKKHMLVVVQD